MTPRQWRFCLQGSASEATLVAMLAARDRTVRTLREEDPKLSDGEIRAKLVAYTSGAAAVFFATFTFVAPIRT